MVVPEFTPSRKQIKAACRKIQRTWSPEETEKRVTGPIDKVAFEVPIVPARVFYATGDEGE
jgi:hypothetical protein